MMKMMLVMVILVFSCWCTEDQDTLQTTLNGAFQQNKLPDPTTIVPCIDPTTASKIVVFIGQLLDKAAKGSIQDLISLIQMIKNFSDQIPQSVKDCLSDNAEFQALGKKYGIDDKTDPKVIQAKVIKYLTLHYPTVHKWFGDLDNQWHAKRYYNVGFNGATDAHEVLGDVELDIEVVK